MYDIFIRIAADRIEPVLSMCPKSSAFPRPKRRVASSNHAEPRLEDKRSVGHGGFSEFLNTEWDGEVRIDDLRFVTSSTVAGQVEFLTVRVGPSAYTKIKGYRVIEEDDSIDTLSQIAAEFVLKVFKPARPSALFLDLSAKAITHH